MSKTQCPQGHEYTEENTYIDKNGYRHCKTCRRERMRVRRPASGLGAGGYNAAKTHCPQNHEYTDENTVYSRKGSRCCRACARVNSALQNVKRYGLVPETVARMLEEQGHRCRICKRKFGDDGVTPAIDHDHACCPGKQRACGKCVRGILCSECNRGLGQFKDSPDLLRAAASYLDPPVD